MKGNGESIQSQVSFHSAGELVFQAREAVPAQHASLETYCFNRSSPTPNSAVPTTSFYLGTFYMKQKTMAQPSAVHAGSTRKLKLLAPDVLP